MGQGEWRQVRGRCRSRCWDCLAVLAALSARLQFSLMQHQLRGLEAAFPSTHSPISSFPAPSPRCTCCLTKVNMSAYIVLHLRRKDMQFVVVWRCCYFAWRCPFRCHPIQLPYNPFSLSPSPPLLANTARLLASLSPSCMLFVLSCPTFVRSLLCCCSLLHLN